MNRHLKVATPAVTRRGFVAGTAGITFALALGTGMAGRLSGAFAANAVQPNTWVTVNTDNTITILAAASEMGQGVKTTLPLIFAEELDADWSKVKIEQAEPHPDLGNPYLFDLLITGGSLTVRGYFQKLRLAGAQARRILMDAVAAEWNVPVAELTTEPGMVVHEKSGRKISYGEIAAFAKMPDKAPEVTEADLKKPEDFRLIGKDVVRVDVPSKVDGTAIYGMDIQVPDMLYAAVLRAPVLESGPDKVDDAEARAVKDIVSIFPLPYGVAIVGTTVEATKKAKAALKVTWKTGMPAEDYTSPDALEAFMAVAKDTSKKEIEVENEGDVPAALSGAAKTLTADYRNDHAYHGTMEPMNATALVSADGKSAEVWVGTQVPSLTQLYGAGVLETEPGKIKVNTTMLGGGFGRRLENDFVVDALIISKATGKPVKVIWSREDDVTHDVYRPLTAQHLQAALDGDGKLTAWYQRLVCDNVAARFDPNTYKQNNGSDLFTHQDIECKYDVPNRLGEYVRQIGGVRVGYWRAVGSGYTRFAGESFIDEIAHELGQDPLEYRMSMLEGRPRIKALVEKVAAMSDWSRKRDGTGLGMAVDDFYGTSIATVVEVSVDKESGIIRLHNVWAAVDPGLTVQPRHTVAQIESGIVFGMSSALKEELTVKNGVVQQENFDTYNVLRQSDMPLMHVELFPTANPPGGIGEVGVPPMGPAIANAVFAQTGVRLRHMPFLPARVQDAMKS